MAGTPAADGLQLCEQEHQHRRLQARRVTGPTPRTATYELPRGRPVRTPGRNTSGLLVSSSFSSLRVRNQSLGLTSRVSGGRPKATEALEQLARGLRQRNGRRDRLGRHSNLRGGKIQEEVGGVFQCGGRGALP